MSAKGETEWAQGPAVIGYEAEVNYSTSAEDPPCQPISCWGFIFFIIFQEIRVGDPVAPVENMATESPSWKDLKETYDAYFQVYNFILG